MQFERNNKYQAVTPPSFMCTGKILSLYTKISLYKRNARFLHVKLQHVSCRCSGEMRSDFHTCISGATREVHCSSYNLLVVKNEESTREAPSPKHYRKRSQEGHFSLNIWRHSRETAGSSNSVSTEAAHSPKAGGCKYTQNASTASPVQTDRNAALT